MTAITEVNVWKMAEEILGLAKLTKIRNSLMLNDKAHQEDHVIGVMMRAVDIVTTHLDGNEDILRMSLLGALFHDIGCRYNRDSHHLIAFGIAWEYLADIDSFNDEQRTQICYAAMEHRASWEMAKKRFSAVSDIVAVADRGDFNVRENIKRSVLMNHSKGLNHDECVNNVVEHIFKKYNEATGYCWDRYPSLGYYCYENQIKDIRAAASNTKFVNDVAIEIIEELGLYA